MYLLVLFLVDYFIITDLRDYASLISTNFTKKKKSPCSHTDFFDQFSGLETTVSPQTTYSQSPIYSPLAPQKASSNGTPSVFSKPFSSEYEYRQYSLSTVKPMIPRSGDTSRALWSYSDSEYHP